MRLHSIVLCAILSFAAGCGGNGQLVVTPDDAGSAADAAIEPDLIVLPPADMATLPNPPLPVMVKHTGKILASMNLVTIAWSNSTYGKLADDFGNMVFSSQWLKAVGAEYGIKGGTHLKHVLINSPAPTKWTDPDMLQWIKDRVADKTLPAPIGDNTLYMLFFPDQDKFTFDDGSGSLLCESYIGYHWYDRLDKNDFTYSVIGDCKLGPEDVGNTASHELIEVATDPYPDQADGWYLDPPDDDPWAVQYGSEVADMCVEQKSVMEGGIALAPSWSNAAAMAGKDPCVPGGKPVYESVQIVSPSGVPAISVGQTITFTIAGWSTDPNEAPWMVELIDTDYGPSVTEQKGMFDAKMLRHGETATVTLTAPRSARRGDFVGGLILSGPDYHIWPIAYTIK